jgi:23S rRNA (cytidine1920-2'-O)/16S rRNA (cytidine1409-2'-O)-methyltransferase
MRSAIAAPKKTKRRIDQLLVDRGLARSRQAAQALVMSRRVHADGKLVDKPGSTVDDQSAIVLDPAPRTWASRGGAKLAGALDAFGIDPAGLTCLDVGASTGGFTDCLLRRGAARVVAVDVGKGQIDWTLRNDKRVVVLDGINARYLKPGMLPEGVVPFPLAVIDVSFISLRHIFPAIAPLLAPAGAGRCVALVKPQFEVGRGKVGKGGIVRDEALRRSAIVDAAAHAHTSGLAVAAIAPSVLPGAEGNREYFLHLVRTDGSLMTMEEIERDAIAIAQEKAD